MHTLSLACLYRNKKDVLDFFLLNCRENIFIDLWFNFRRHQVFIDKAVVIQSGCSSNSTVEFQNWSFPPPKQQSNSIHSQPETVSGSSNLPAQAISSPIAPGAILLSPPEEEFQGTRPLPFSCTHTSQENHVTLSTDTEQELHRSLEAPLIQSASLQLITLLK